MNLSKKEPDSDQITDLLFQLGMTYLEKGDYDNAIEKLKQITDLGKASAKVYLNLSKAYILKEQFDQEAQHIFEQSLQFEPDNPVLNVILSKLYLDADREDELAQAVYQKALKQNPQNADEISSKLIKISFRQENIDTARQLMQDFLTTPDKISQFLPLYIVNEWKHQGFSRVRQYLKQALEVQQELVFYRWFVVNLLQAEKQSSEPVELSQQELEICYQYLTDTSNSNQLLDIYLAPSVERLVQKYTQKMNETPSNPVEEYQIFLAEDALSNIWERGLNKRAIPASGFELPREMIWQKLKRWHIGENGLDQDAASENQTVDNIQHQAETVMVMRIKGNGSNAISTALSDSVSLNPEATSAFIAGFQSDDGFLLFWKDANSPIQTAIHFIENISAQKHSDFNNESKYQFIIHRLTGQGKNRSLAKDLQTALSSFQLEREMFFQENHLDQRKKQPQFQLLVTSTLKEKINGENQYTLEPLELQAQYPTDNKNLPLYQLRWDNSLDKIKKGEIKQLGNFKLLKELHQNQVFSSFKAVDTFLDRLVVIKILRPDFSIGSDQNATAQLFLQEAKFLGQLSHPNVALVYDIGKQQKFCYIAREYVEGVPLAIQRSINRKINVPKTLMICLQISATLSELHQQQIFHGRLQPHNIFVFDNNEIKLADIQVRSFAIPIKNYHTTSLKYLSYFAPEQIDSNEFNHLTDMFSLGVIMYEMLTNHHPFYHDDRERIFDNIFNKTPEPLSSYNPDLPGELDELVLKALEKSPENRYENMAELTGELTSIIESMG